MKNQKYSKFGKDFAALTSLYQRTGRTGVPIHLLKPKGKLESEMCGLYQKGRFCIAKPKKKRRLKLIDK